MGRPPSSTSSRSPSPPDCERPHAFLVRSEQRAGPFAAGTTVVYERLVAAAVDVPLTVAPLRRPSMCHDGTPIVYSAAVDRDGGSPLRLLVEPGGTGVDVPTQIIGAIAVLETILADGGCAAARRHVTPLMQRLFPHGIAATRGWWGGVWLGLVSSSSALEVRVYANLRFGEARARWQRACDVICAFADHRLTPMLDDLVRRAASVGVPVGMGIAFRAGALRALRLYVGVEAPAAAEIRAALPPTIQPEAAHADLFCRSFTDRFGEFAPQSVTLGYDFVLDEGESVVPGIARVKIDASCQLLDGDRRAEAASVASELARELELDPKAIELFEADLAAVFGGSAIEFISLSLRTGHPSLGVYAKPANFAPLNAA